MENWKNYQIEIQKELWEDSPALLIEGHRALVAVWCTNGQEHLIYDYESQVPDKTLNLMTLACPLQVDLDLLHIPRWHRGGWMIAGKFAWNHQGSQFQLLANFPPGRTMEGRHLHVLMRNIKLAYYMEQAKLSPSINS